MLLNVLKNLVKHRADCQHQGENSTGKAGRQIPLEFGNRLVDTRHGWMIANENDFYLGKSLAMYGECIEIEQRFLAQYLSEGDCVLEVGANIGVLTVPFARRVGQSGQVIAIEPQPQIFNVLCANVALNSLGNVVPMAIGCGSIPSTMYLPRTNYVSGEPHNSGGVSLLESGDPSAVQAVPVRPIDEICKDIDRLRMIKIDAEGMEESILDGARATIARHRPILFVENDRLDRSQSLIEWLMRENYRLWWSVTHLFNRDNFFGITDNCYGNTASYNMFCAPRERIENPFLPETKEIRDAAHHPLRVG